MSLSGIFSQSLSLNRAIDHNFLTMDAQSMVGEVLAVMGGLSSHCLVENREEIYPKQKGKNEGGPIGYNSFFQNKPLTDCVLITEGDLLIGIFTERDTVKLTATNRNLENLQIKEVINLKPIVLQYSENLNIFNALSILHQHQIRHLPIVNQDFKPIGLVTFETIRKSLQPVNLLTRINTVADVMTRQIITAKSSDSLVNIAKLMSSYRVGCIVIIEENNHQKFPVGIITEKDLVQFNALSLNLEQTQAEKVMSSPLFSLAPRASLWEANERMKEYKVRRLVVTETTGELLGLITQGNLLKVLNPTDMYGVIEVLQTTMDDQTTKLEGINQSLLKEIAQKQISENSLILGYQKLQEETEQKNQELQAINLKFQQDLQEKERIEMALRASEEELRKQTAQMQETLDTLQKTQLKLIQTEKMSSVGQLVAGIAHEINNPVNFIYGNITYAQEYVTEILDLLELYQQSYPHPPSEIEEKSQEMEIDFLKEDLSKLLKSMKVGAERIRDLVISLRNFSRLNESQMKMVNIHEGLDNTLVILQNQLILKGSHQGIQVMKQYAHLPEVECYPGQLNQVFMNIIANAIDSLQDAFVKGTIKQITIQGQQFNFPMILIKTEESSDRNYVIIRIIDNGKGLSEDTQKQLFNPFFTTKQVGKGTGLGLSISYQIITEKHKGTLECFSSQEMGTEFVIKIPKSQTHPQHTMWPL